MKIQLNKNNIRNILIASGIFGVIGFSSVLVSQYSAFKSVHAQWMDEKSKMGDLKNEIVQIKKFIESYNQEKAEFAKLLFEERDVPAFLDEIAKFAKQSSINIIDMKTQQFYQVQVPQKAKDAPQADNSSDAANAQPKSKEELERALTLSAMPIQIKVKGTFPNFVQFLDHLQEYKQLLNIANVEIQTSQEYPMLDCQFMIRIYSLKTLGELQHRWNARTDF